MCRRSTIELMVGYGLKYLELSAEEGESTLPFAFSQLRPMITHYSSPELDRFIQEALGTCSRDHQLCGILQSVPLPKRLINVGGADQPPFLYTTLMGESGQYICLSHCWGSPSYTLKTRKVNLEAHTREIPITDMPRTFSEAVLLTRRIGIQYLWIDSLCIVQDDEDDWRSESETMAQIYANSTITIVAAEAADSREGLISRFFAEDGNVSFIDWPLPDAQSCRIYTREGQGIDQRWKPYHQLRQPKSMASKTAVLFSRAWTMQELLLPSRLLMFTARGPIWYCNEIFQPATDPVPLICTPRSGLIDMNQPSLRQLGGISPNSIDETIFPRLSRIGDGWVNLVKMYTSRHLTFRQDRLRALAGLAKKFQQQSKVEYLAGLWDDKASLPFFLGWDVVPVKRKRENPCVDPTDCMRSWNPPSWSWASAEGAVSWALDREKFRADAQITAVSCQWQDANRFSTSLGGEITMKARVLKLSRSRLFYCPKGNKVVEPGDYCYQISLKDFYPRRHLSEYHLFGGASESSDDEFLDLSGEVWMFKVPGSDCDLHRLDWIKKRRLRSVKIHLVLLGDMSPEGWMTVLFLAHHPAPVTSLPASSEMGASIGWNWFVPPPPPPPPPW
ncbi:hypothetical protein PG990_015322 [Apiospora arundinis]